jgi:hypothetical protein
MANPYEWSQDRERRYGDAQREAEADRAPERHAGQDQAWDAGDRRYGRTADFDRRDGPARAGEDLKRGWRRFSQGVRRAFDEDRPGGYDADPRRGGGMFGGEDRPDSLFSHRDVYRGKGPKGYVRSDARILEDVNDRLADDRRLDARDIEVKVEAGEVTLNGQVRSREGKRRAEDLAEQVSGVKHLQNNLRVRPAEAQAAASMAGAAIGSKSPTPKSPTPKPPTH